jgi:hypothetical protein
VRDREHGELFDELRRVMDGAVEQSGTAMIVIPKMMVPQVHHAAFNAGIKVVMVDDGEDDGVPAYAITMDPDSMQVPIDRYRHNRNAGAMSAVVWLVVTAAWFYAGLTALVGVAALLVGRYAWLAWLGHQRFMMYRRHQATLRRLMAEHMREHHHGDE